MGGWSVRRALRGVGLVVSGAAVLALALAVTAAATWWSPSAARFVEAVPQVVGAGATTWVCPPRAQLTDGDEAPDDADPDLGSGAATAPTSSELVAVGADAAPEVTSGPLGEQGSEAGTAGTLTQVTQAETEEPLVAVVAPTAAGVPLVAGAAVSRADSGDLRGLAASSCRQPAATSVLVGGVTELGASARLELVNPGETPATVRISGWGATGPLPETTPVVVPAGQARSVLLETISLEPRLAIRVDADGGRVVATIGERRLDGLVPAGSETIGATADPATTLTVGPVPLDDAGVGGGEQPARLRLVNPGADPATVAVELLGPDGPVALEGSEGTVVEAGTVSDVSLSGVPAGSYTVRVTSDEPVAGSVELARSGEAGEDDPDTPPVDVASLPATVPTARGLLLVPDQLVDQVGLRVTNASPDADEIAARAYDADGEMTELDTLSVPAGSTAALEVPDGTVAVELTGTAVLASATLVADAPDGPLVSMLPLTPDPFVEQSVPVRVSSP